MKSPVPYYTDEQFERLPLSERAILVAARECDILKVKEEGNNRGKRVEEYLGAVGLSGGYAWCAAFVSWCLREAGWTKFKSARVYDWYKFGRNQNRIIEEPKRGCLFFYLNKDKTGHIGFVTKVLPLFVATVEGNTNDDGSREGYKVARRLRLKSKVKFIEVGW